MKAYDHPTKPFSAWALLRGSLCLASCLGLLTLTAQAQVYKWVGPNGKTVFSDTPPPSNVKTVTRKGLNTSGSISNVKLPPELELASSKNPVTLYSTSNCAACNDARSMLKQNGIPFFEKTVKSNEDIQQLKLATGDSQVPSLMINRAKFIGFESPAWRDALSKAGYPENSVLPKEYRYPDPEPAAPSPATAKKEEPKASDTIVPRSVSPTGIRF